MMKKYAGYALITGGSSGFGLEFAKQLAALGYNLVLVARNEARLESAKKLLCKEFGIDIVTIVQDLSKFDSTDNICEILYKNKIYVGLLVNNAGMGAMRRFHEIPLDLTLDIIKVMCLSVTNLTHKLLPAMLEKGSGGIIFMSSIAARFPGPFNAVYAASKAFELELAISLHGEYKKCGIDVLALCPGVTETDIFNSGEVNRPLVKPLYPESIVKTALKSLGKRIAITFPNDRGTSLALFLSGILPYKLCEKSILGAMKRLWGLE